MNLRSIGLGLWAEGHRFVIFRDGRRGVVAVENRTGHKDGDDDNSNQKCDRQPAAFFRGDQIAKPPDFPSRVLSSFKNRARVCELVVPA